MWSLISIALVLLVTALPGSARGQANQCGDVNSDGAVNFIDAKLILLGQMLPCPVCGNGVIEPGEDCDVGDLGGATCGLFAYGQVTCTLGCTHDFSGCRDERWEDNGDGTVTDWATGLMWETKVEGSGCLHCVDDTYPWEPGYGTGPNPSMFDWLSELNGDDDEMGFAGYSDWRIPTSAELWTCPPGPYRPYWSSTGSGEMAWVVAGLASVTAHKSEDYYVRAVRGGP